MKPYFYFLVFILIGILSSCSSKTATSTLEYTDQELTIGLASPIRLNYQATDVLVADYLDQTNIVITSINCSPGYDCTLSDDHSSVRILARPDASTAGNLRISTTKDHVDVLLIKSSKIKHTFSFDPGSLAYDKVALVGDINAWNPSNTPMVKIGNNWQADLYLSPGKYAYQVVVDGEWILDPNNSNQMPNGIGGTNSILTIEHSDLTNEPKLHSCQMVNNRLVIQSSNHADHAWVYLDNKRLELPIPLKGQISLDPQLYNNKKDRSHLRVWASNSKGLSNDLLLPLQDGEILLNASRLTRHDLHTQVMYFLMVDRFFNADKSNDRPEANPDIKPLANHLGGDIKGVTKKLNEDYFNTIGANTIWLSPILQNPEGAYGLWDKGGVRSTFSAYHGYWPSSFKEIDYRFGTSIDLTHLVDQSHAKHNNLILDVVANHVHELHPMYQKHKDEGWATNLYLPDGSLNTEKWDEHRLTTWFDTFLPTLNLERQDITEMLSDSILYLLDKYNLDGFRHDATKHIPINFWQTLTKKIKAHTRANGEKIYQVGETYGTPQLISSYISTGMLDGQFDFNMYDALVQTIVRDDFGFDNVAHKINESFKYYGSHHLMGNMTGNQDKPRFMALATQDVRLDEDSKLAGWTRDINKKTDIGYKKLEMMHAFNFLLPGIPCIYYGDEIGITGGNDPDNRRMMKFDDLTAAELSLKSSVSELGKWRQSYMSLLYGDFTIETVQGNLLVCSREYLDQKIYAIFNLNDRPYTYTIDAGDKKWTASLKLNALEERLSIINISVPAYGYEFILFNKK